MIKRGQAAQPHSLGICRILLAFSCVITWAVACSASDDAATNETLDTIIKHGTIVDGTGAVQFQGDVGIVDGKIAAIGDLSDRTSHETIDARDKIIAPGFIDIHAHVVDGQFGKSGLRSSDARRRAAPNFVSQGVTTVLGNPDGSQDISLTDQISEMEEGGIGLNVALTNGHVGIRDMVMGDDSDRPATLEEIDAIKRIVTDDMKAGRSFGLSVGTEYGSSRFSALEEHLSIAETLQEHDGIYIAHMRSQGDAPMWYKPSQFRDTPPVTLTEAMDEVIAVAETGITAVMTHMKAWGSYRGRADALIERIQSVRDNGVNLYIDVYPYSSSGSDGRFVALPLWVYDLSEGSDIDQNTNYSERLTAMLTSMTDEQKAGLLDDVTHEVAMRGGVDNILVLEHPQAGMAGRTVGEIIEETGSSPLETFINLQLNGDSALRGGGRMRSISMAERDIATFYAQPWAATSTDGWVVLPEEAVGVRKYIGTHRRCFGSFPNRLAYFSKVLGVGSLEETIRSMTSLPASIVGLRDRGQIKVGYAADVVVFDLAQLQDKTTYREPSVYPAGIEYVFVNGNLAVEKSERTFGLHGRVLSNK